jgi:hypothetical protein
MAKIINTIDLHDYLNSLEFDKEKYSEYNSMSAYEKTSLPATNYWRVRNGKSEIPVPPQDKHYKKYFDKRCHDLIGQSTPDSFRTKTPINSDISEKTKKTELVAVESKIIEPIVAVENKSTQEVKSVSPPKRGKSKLKNNDNNNSKTLF